MDTAIQHVAAIAEESASTARELSEESDLTRTQVRDLVALVYGHGGNGTAQEPARPQEGGMVPGRLLLACG